MGQGNGHAGTVIVEIETDVLAVTNLRQDQSGEITLIEIRLSPERTNIPGYYRKCADDKCNRYIPCPHVKCQEHRDDFAIKDWDVPSYAPGEVQIVK